MDFDLTTDPDTLATKTLGTASPPGGRLPDEAETTITLSRLDRGEAEAGLLFGLLGVANGLIAPQALTRALGAWTGQPGRSLDVILIERGDLDEAGASMVAALAARHLEQHLGIAWQSLIALGAAVRFRLDPNEISDPGLRAILTGFVADPPTPRAGTDTAGFGPRYEILKHHAKGGLGIVSLAHDRELHREVALKEIREDCADNLDYRARFLREAEVTGRLEHPGIVPVYGMGHRDDGRPYYIMRFIRGETLKRAIARLHKAEDAIGEIDGPEAGPGDPIDRHALVGRLVDACHAVAYAHHRKILHRDLKPINIMLGPFGETLVVDWGLAKTFDGSRSGEYPAPVEEGTLRPESGSGMTPTTVGALVGTVGHMSPEQAAGRLDDLGPPSDIYSLGIILYQLATGCGPFVGAGRDEFLRRVREGDFPRPRKINPSVPRALEAVCLKAMALRPIDRYQAVGEMVDDLERWMAGQPVLAYPEPLPDRLARSAKKYKTGLAGAAVLLVCTTIGLAVFAEQKREENRLVRDQRDISDAKTVEAVWERAEADKQRSASEDKRRFALGLLKSTLREIAGADLAFLARSEPLRVRMADELVEGYRKLSAQDPDDRQTRLDLAQACLLAANIGRSMGQLDRPVGLYADSIRLLESLDDWHPEGTDTRLELAMIHDDEGEYFRTIGKPKEAEAEYRQGLETLGRPTLPPRAAIDRDRAEARLELDLSGALNDLGRFGLAKEASGRAIGLLKPLASQATADRTDRLLFVFASLNRAEALRLGREFAEATTELADAARRARELMNADNDPDTRYAFASVRNAQGFLILDTNPDGSRDAALKPFQDALYYLKPLYDGMPRVIHFQRGVTSTLIGRGICHLSLKRFAEARSDLSIAKRLLEQMEATIPGHFANLELFGLAFASLARTSWAESKADAVDLMHQAIGYYDQAGGANRESPEREKSLAECRQELIRFEAGTAAIPLRP